MTTVSEIDVSTLARSALAAIAKTRKGHVCASRKGIFAAVHSGVAGEYVGFRRVGERVQLELWQEQGMQKQVYRLPVSLERRAEEMLDAL